MTTQKTETLYHCKLCGRHGFVKRGAHRPPPGVAGQSCKGDFVELKPQSCFNCNWRDKRACPPQITVLAREPWLGCTSWSQLAEPTMSLSTSSSSLPSVNPLRTFTFKRGDPDKIAADFKDAFAKTERASKVVAAFGVLAAHVKTNLLRHGQFGDWVEAQCGATSYRSVRGYMKFAESVLKKSGVRSLDAFVSKWQDLPICHRGEFLLLPDNQVPEPVRKIRKKALDIMENKTVNQLFFEFKQAEEDEQGNAKKKVGRLPGHGGATHAQREAKQAADKKADKVAKEAAIKGFGLWIKKNCVDTADGIGLVVSDAALQSLNDWCKVAFDYTTRILAARGKA